MRKLIGALCVAGLMAGCGGTVEETETSPTTTAAPTDTAGGNVGALALCKKDVAHYARYYYENGKECGLKYWFCDGREAGRGCETTTYTELYNCSCP